MAVKDLSAVWVEELAVQMLDDAGFKNVQVKRLDHDIMKNYDVCK